MRNPVTEARGPYRHTAQLPFVLYVTLSIVCCVFCYLELQNGTLL